MFDALYTSNRISENDACFARDKIRGYYYDIIIQMYTNI